LFDLPELLERAKVQAPDEQLGARPFGGGGRWLITHRGRELLVRDARTLQPLLALPPQRGDIVDVTVSPRDEVAVCGRESTLTVYDLKRLRQDLADLGLDWSDD
jgi:hypothetical protein